MISVNGTFNLTDSFEGNKTWSKQKILYNVTFEKSYTSVIWSLSIYVCVCVYIYICMYVYHCIYVYYLNVFPILGDISCLGIHLLSIIRIYLYCFLFSCFANISNCVHNLCIISYAKHFLKHLASPYVGSPIDVLF